MLLSFKNYSSDIFHYKALRFNFHLKKSTSPQLTSQYMFACVMMVLFPVIAAGVGALLGRFQMTEGPCKPSQLSVQFTSEGSTLSGCDIQLVGTGYRLSLVKKRFAAGRFELVIMTGICV